ncbi:MAG: hypothetical protein LBS26_02525 [Campylobacteraceae bacterium]|nr:hypothetical protein [Campylobacteraceae bacterium]
MHRYVIQTTIIIYFGMCSFSFAQENTNMIKILNIEQDIVSLENRITDLIKKKPAIANIQGLRQFHILLLGFSDYNKVEIKKEDYLDYSFLYQLRQSYYHLGSNSLFAKKKKYLSTITLVTDSTGNLVATSDARLVHIAPVFDQKDIELAKMFFDKEIDFILWLETPHITRYMVGIKDNNLYALERTKEGLKIYSWDEFMKCCFDKWIVPRKQ